MPDMSPETRVVRVPDLIASEMDGDLVMMSIERGEYYGISGVGTRAWELLEHPVSLAEIVATICQEFEVDAAIGEQDMRKFLEELIHRGLVQTVA
ncbi:lasso peptide biosynthesis PqqD family chaperone [Solimonas sp. SE-A11]|uniref:lasso peptide biosynthesis PqqD family chaperone n=1 Tax=Solimonas sp. SE-A11 TaxID=3054954 RepID=UPI00259C763F|nr:lasso peptide biosynthesis PqqD family chaperone [Solimonas sp. SE-A11]MDM4769034.1 lasso peptide biosynthesis PqqD family chaperone [Solimonas sp. SE-A11]